MIRQSLLFWLAVCLMIDSRVKEWQVNNYQMSGDVIRNVLHIKNHNGGVF